MSTLNPPRVPANDSGSVGPVSWYEVVPAGPDHGYAGPDFDEALARLLNIDQDGGDALLITRAGTAAPSIVALGEVVEEFERLFPGARAEMAAQPGGAA